MLHVCKGTARTQGARDAVTFTQSPSGENYHAWICMGDRYTTSLYSRWVESNLLTAQTAKSVITASKELFATNGITDIVIADHGPCLVQNPSKSVLPVTGLFTRTTSSPRYPQANGEVLEKAVRTVNSRTVKKIMTPNLRSSPADLLPLQTGLSPSELLMGPFKSRQASHFHQYCGLPFWSRHRRNDCPV